MTPLCHIRAALERDGVIDPQKADKLPTKSRAWRSEQPSL